MQALEIIWKHQNPPDCSKVKYLIADGWMQGFGSEMHGYGAMLGIALDTGILISIYYALKLLLLLDRVLVHHGGWTWRYRNEHCTNQSAKGLDCYYYPFSKCTLEDAVRTMIKPTTSNAG